jgi:hypothetical protein
MVKLNYQRRNKKMMYTLFEVNKDNDDMIILAQDKYLIDIELFLKSEISYTTLVKRATDNALFHINNKVYQLFKDDIKELM